MHRESIPFIQDLYVHRTTAPGVTDDGSHGFFPGMRWLDTVGSNEYVCVSNAIGAAVWIQGGSAAGATAAAASAAAAAASAALIDFTAPGPIGGTTPDAISGTTISASVVMDSPSYKAAGTKVMGTRVTGYVAMTGTPDKGTAFDVATVTLPQLAARVAALQAALTAHGAIGV